MSLQVKLKKSLNGVTKKQKQTAICLGLRRINQSRVVEDNPAVRGQIDKIKHLITCEEVK